MDNTIQSNEEQFKMLLMTLEEVKQGMCLFQSQYQAGWVSLIRKKLGEERVIVHNIAEDDKEKGMVNIGDFRRWASESNADIVIVYNLQLLGLRFGDDEAIEKLNFMRDQIQAIGKLFVFGVTKYFGLLLSRKARDLYSCILYHFEFYDAGEAKAGMLELNMERATNDDILALERYKETKARIQNDDAESRIALYLNCMESWNAIRGYLPWQEKEFILTIAENTNEYFLKKELEINELESIWILAGTWIGLEKAEKSVYWYQKALDLVRERLGEEHVMYADALEEYMAYYETVSDYAALENACDQALKIYSEKNAKYFDHGRAVLQRKAILCRRQSKFDEALAIYEDLLKYQVNKYGEKYYWNASIYNNIGRVYEEQGDVSEALTYYTKALELLENTGKQDGEIEVVNQNICILYLKNGDGTEAWKYIKRAKKRVEDVYGEDSIRLIEIYNCMAGVWQVRERRDKEFEYLQKALELIKKTHMEDSENAAYVYHNLSNLFSSSGDINSAMTYCMMAINIRERIYGEKSGLTASSYEMLGYIFYQRADHAEGRKNINKARDIYITLYGPKNEHVRRIDSFLSECRTDN